MVFNGYKVNPSTDIEKRKNAEIERQFGKGFYPDLKTTGRGEFLDLTCNNFVEKK